MAASIDPAARALLEAALASHGRPERIRRITSVVRRGKIRVHGTALNARFVRYTRIPDRMRVEDDTIPFIAALDGDRAWMKIGDDSASGADHMAGEVREGVWEDPLVITVASTASWCRSA